MRKRGFTLIELLVVIAIIGILSAIVLSSVGHRAHADSTTNQDSCGGWFEPSCDSASYQAASAQSAVAQNMSKLIAQTPVPNLDNSLERANIIRRLTAFSDPAKISYIYLINYGHVMSYYVVKGKITSGGKRLTPTSQVVYQNGGGTPDNVLEEAPELDGTYGSSNAYIYFWTTDGTYVQWSGDYMLTDQPVAMAQQPELSRQVK